MLLKGTAHGTGVGKSALLSGLLLGDTLTEQPLGAVQTAPLQKIKQGISGFLFDFLPQLNAHIVKIADKILCIQKLSLNQIGKELLYAGPALYLTRTGHQVTLITRRDRVATGAQFSHYYGGLMDAIHQQKELTVIPSAVTTGVTHTTVTYQKNGVAATISADDVVACGGMQSLQQEAMDFYGTAGKFYAIGDCKQVGNIHTCTRGALAAAGSV